MAKQLTTLPVSHANAAGFQAWATELSGWFDFLNLTQTADTGQINLAGIAAVPAINTSGGYQIRYMNDSQNANFPLVFKFEYGTNATITNPNLWMTVGTGSDGAGNITGIIIARIQMMMNNALGSIVNPYVSLGCFVDGTAWMIFKRGVINGTADFMGLAIHRHHDPVTEATIGDATTIIYTSNNAATWTTFIKTVNGFRTSSIQISNPVSLSPSTVNGAAQTWRAYHPTPLVAAMKGFFWAQNEFGQYNKVAQTPLSIAHTYIMLAYLGGGQEIQSSGYMTGYLWE